MNKIIYFRERTDTPLKVVKDRPGDSGCRQCYFMDKSDGCPSWGEEKRAGAGRGCSEERHHYTEHECAS